jgi:predicted GNAT superfamily acetyltransferase
MTAGRQHELRAPQRADEPGIVLLNEANVIETSPLDEHALRSLLGQAFHQRVAGVDPLDGFLLAFDEGARYGSPNFAWFRERQERFVYVDRVLVAHHARRRGLARAFYVDLIGAARAAQKPLLCCEVNVDPPNPASDALHSALGFVEAGRARLASDKTVRYLELALC